MSGPARTERCCFNEMGLMRFEYGFDFLSCENDTRDKNRQKAKRDFMVGRNIYFIPLKLVKIVHCFARQSSSSYYPGP